MKMIFKRLLTLALALLFALGLPSAMAESAPADAPEAPAAEETAPENFFTTLELTYLDGTPFDSSVFAGKPVFLNIWATWCGPCVNEMPHLDELAREYADRITIVGLHAEGLTVSEQGEIVPNEERTQAALALQADKGLTFPLLNPDFTMFVLMNDPQYGLSVSVLPTTWLIDGEGFIRAILPSSNDKAGWARVIEEFLSNLEKEANDKNEG